MTKNINLPPIIDNKVASSGLLTIIAILGLQLGGVKASEAVVEESIYRDRPNIPTDTNIPKDPYQTLPPMLPPPSGNPLDPNAPLTLPDRRYLPTDRFIDNNTDPYGRSLPVNQQRQ